MEKGTLKISSISTPEELVAASKVIKRGWQATYQSLFTPDELSGLDEHLWQVSLRQPGRHNLIALNGQRVIGVVSFGQPRQDEYFRKGWGELMSIYVLPECQGQGVGTLLMKAGEAGLKKLGFAHFALWVIENNRRAIRFYTQLGWRASGPRQQRVILRKAVSLVQLRK